MINAIIIDDEQHCIDAIQKLAKSIGKLQILNTYTTIEQALKGVEKHQPDLVFLDVQINEATGFDFLKYLKSITFEVIFKNLEFRC
mgnify:CR=1 FL=1